MAEGTELLAEIFDVRGSRAIVTGAASGIGRAIAEVFAHAGAVVALADRDEAGAELAMRALRNEGCNVETLIFDITDDHSLDLAFEKYVANHGGIDVVFANAGGGTGVRVGPEERDLAHYPEFAFAKGIAQNLTGAVATVRSAVRHMRPARAGRIVVTASTAGLRPDPYVTWDYAAAKAGLVNFVRQAALDLAPDGIRINAIAPGPFRTNIGGPAANDPEVIARWAATVPLGRMGNTSELRGLALLLGSNASSFMTGAVYPIDGGALALSELN